MVDNTDGSARDDDTDGSARDLKLWVAWFFVLVAFAWLVAVAWAMARQTGLFSGGLDSEDLGSAVWGFLGTGVLAVGALVAALFTYSYNERTIQLAEDSERRASMEGDAKTRLAEHAEGRARNEAMSKLLGILTADQNSGKGPTAAQIAGVEIGLRNLGEQSVADGVLEAAIEDDALTPGTAVRLLAPYLESNDKDRVTEGARLLMGASLRGLTKTDGRLYRWPESLRYWPKTFAKDAKVYILVAVGRTLATQNQEFWKGQRDWAVFLLHEALSDSDPSVSDGAWLLLRTIVDAKKIDPKDVGPFTRAKSDDHPSASLSAKLLDKELKGGPNWRWDPLVRIADELVRARWERDPKLPTPVYLHLIDAPSESVTGPEP